MNKLLYPFETEEKIFHRVAFNETLFDIAAKYGVSVQKIIALNSLARYPAPHTVLYVERENCELYFFKPKDTAEKLAESCGINCDELLRINAASYFYPYMLVQLPRRRG